MEWDMYSNTSSVFAVKITLSHEANYAILFVTTAGAKIT